MGLIDSSGSRGIIGEYLVEGENMVEADSLVIQVRPMGSASDPFEVVTILQVVGAPKCFAPTELAPSGLRPATQHVYHWRTEHVSFRAKLAELLAAKEHSPLPDDLDPFPGIDSNILIQTLLNRGVTQLL
jgi:hypothetical protein